MQYLVQIKIPQHNKGEYDRAILDFTKAIEKMKQIEEITAKLRGLDCGSCGAPNCRALAEDIVQGKAKLDDCVHYKEQQHLWRLEDESE